MSPLTNSDWVDLLGERFFRPEYASAHIMFYVDRPLLAELASLPEDKAVESLVRAVAFELRRNEPRALFSALRSKSFKWKTSGGDGPPPCLGALALAVLAATDMRKEGTRASHNYYDWFFDLLRLGGIDLDDHAVWTSYADSYPLMWELLKWWLDEKHRGALGFSTIERDDHFTKMGYADSQTIFASSDREKLTRFFRWIRFKPGDRLSRAELLQYFEIWARGRDDLSPGTEVMLEDPARDKSQLADLLLAAARRWEGVVRDDQGRSQAVLSLTLSRFPRPRFGLVAPRPPGFPQTFETSYGGEPIRLESDDASDFEADELAWYEPLDFPVTDRILGNGFELTSGDFVIRLPPYWVHVFHQSTELGCWASFDQLQPSTPARLLVRSKRFEGLSAFLDDHAQEHWSVVQTEGISPEGWMLIRDVVIDPFDSPPPEGFQRLTPRISNRLELSGGLPLPRGQRIYLTGGDPDLTLPPELDGSQMPDLRVNGQTVQFPDGGTLAPLVELGLGAETHAVEFGTITFDYTTIDTVGNARPPVDDAIGHSLTIAADGTIHPRSLDAVRQLGNESGVAINGSFVKEEGQSPSDAARPVVLPIGARRRILLGIRPGEVEFVEAPVKPRWMSTVGLECQSFEHYPMIQPKWLIAEWSSRRPTVTRLDGPFEGVDDRPLDAGAWSTAINGVPEESVTAGDRGGWAELKKAAAVDED